MAISRASNSTIKNAIPKNKKFWDQSSLHALYVEALVIGGGGSGGAVYATSAGYASGPGGSGVVIISYAGSQRGTGGTVTSSGGYTIHTFTSSGTYNA